MKKTIFYLVAAMAVLACSKTEEKEVVVEPQKPVYTLYGTIAQETGTKVVIHDDGVDNDNKHWFSHYWQKNDKISVFSGAGGQGGSQYTVTEESDGKSAGTFTGSFGVGDTFYAIYPYNSSNAVDDSGDNPAFTVTYPAAQTLTEGSYDPAANVYVATGAGTELTFYNTTAYLRLALYSSTSATVSKIELTALSNTSAAVAIAGTGTVTLVTENDITSVDAVSVSGSNTITLTSENEDGESISNDSDSPTYFYVAVPAIDYATNFAGYQVKIYSEETIDENKVETYQFRNISNKLSPNTVRLMSPLEYNPVSSGSTATLKIGTELNAALKTLAGTPLSGTDLYKTEDQTIKHIIIETNKNMTGYTGGTNQTVVSANTSAVPIIASWNSDTKTIRIQTAASKILTQECKNMFSYFKALSSIIGLESFVIGSGAHMGYMFYGDSVLENLDLSGVTFEDPTKTNSIIQLVAFCTSLSSFTSPASIKTASCQNVFQDCTSLTTLDLSSFNTSSTTSMSKMFYGCSSLESVDLSSFNTTNVTNMSEMFSGCSSLKGTLILTNFNTKKVTNASKMFYNCSSLTGITFGSNSTFAACTDMSYMFFTCEKITELNLSMFSNSVVTTMAYMFQYCRELVTLDISGISTEYLLPGTTGTTGGFTRFLNVCNNVKLVKFGPNFTLTGVKNYTNGLQGTTNLLSTPEEPMVFWCSATLAQNFIKNLVSVRTWLNKAGGPIILFKTTDGEKDLVLSDSPGSVTVDTTVSEPE